MNLERDKFLTEQLGECWHMYNTKKGLFNCIHCQKELPKNNNFSTWEGFGKLWEWVSLQENMMCGLASRYNGEQAKIKLIYINPDNFADVVYDYLKEKDK